MARARNMTFVGLFLLLIFGVPIAQAIIDVKLEEEPRPRAVEVLRRAPTEKNLRAFEKELEEGSWFEQQVRPQFQLARYALLRDLGEKAVRGRGGWYFYRPGVRYLVQRDFRHEPPAEGADPLEVIADFARQLRARGIALLVVPVPGKASIYPERLVRFAGDAARVAGHTRRFIHELRMQGVDVLDLHQTYLALRERAADGAPALYMRTDTHWTGEGVRVAAAAIAAAVRRQPWYRAGSYPRRQYRRKRVVVQRQGDILRMTQIPQQERWFAREKVACYQVSQRSGGELYDDEDESSILLLGDSFSRVFQTDAPESAGLVANLAYELQTPLATIVNDGGASTLVRQELARDLSLLDNKRLVIWAFVERDLRFGLRGWQRIALR